jgi:hypothetical protein
MRAFVLKPFMPAHMSCTPPAYNPKGRFMGKRPDNVKPPEYLSPNTPVPAPEPMQRPAEDPLGRDPVRYGDWEKKGIAIDF